MDYISTRFISYSSIDVDEIDLYEDAYGLNTEFCDVKELLAQLNVEPGRSLTDRLIWKAWNLT